jgi:hypothetical protein
MKTSEYCSERRKLGLEKGFGTDSVVKVEESDPTVLAAALRELEEEACIQALDAERSWSHNFHLDR